MVAASDTRPTPLRTAATDVRRTDGDDDMMSGVAEADPKSDLRRYLQRGREALVWKLDGLSEYDIRRPLVPTGTNLLGS